jgi:hypothetical protein
LLRSIGVPMTPGAGLKLDLSHMDRENNNFNNC